MAKFLTTKGVSLELENIINNSKSRLVLLSPYMSISNLHIQNIKSISNKGVKVQLICREKNQKNIEVEKLKTIKSLQVFVNKDLHAKCYFNESSMIITSLNLYEYSESNNREFGVLIDRNNDKELYSDAINEIKRIIENSHEIKVGNLATDHTNSIHLDLKEEVDNYDYDDAGYCIRCSEVIELDIERPYCYKCFKVWNKYSDPSYEEDFCHYCGETGDSSMEFPMHKKCYNKY